MSRQLTLNTARFSLQFRLGAALAATARRWPCLKEAMAQVEAPAAAALAQEGVAFAAMAQAWVIPN